MSKPGSGRALGSAGAFLNDHYCEMAVRGPRGGRRVVPARGSRNCSRGVSDGVAGVRREVRRSVEAGRNRDEAVAARGGERRVPGGPPAQGSRAISSLLNYGRPQTVSPRPADPLRLAVVVLDALSLGLVIEVPVGVWKLSGPGRLLRPTGRAR